MKITANRESGRRFARRGTVFIAIGAMVAVLNASVLAVTFDCGFIR